MIEGKSVIASAPGQNLSTKNSTERFIPFLTAEVLTRVQEYYSGQELPRVDMWNNFGLRMDVAYYDSGTAQSRYAYSTRLLDQKYNLLGSFGISLSDRCVVRDDDPEVISFTQNKVKSLFDQGVFYKDCAEFNTCDNCGYMISEVSTPVSVCSKCKGKTFHSSQSDALFLDIPEEKKSLLEDKVVLPRNTLHIQGMLGTLPHRVAVNRKRDFGVKLDSFGFEGFTLDPKIGLSLMPEFVTSEYGFEQFTQVQGIRTVNNTPPYTSILSPDMSIGYVFLQRIPKLSIEAARDLGTDFVTKYLPLYLATRKRDVSEAELQKVASDHQKIQRKVDNTFKVLSRESTEHVNLDQKDQDKTDEIIQSFLRYDIASGLAGLRTFIYDVLSSEYANRLKSSDQSLHPKTVDSLKDMIGLAI